MLAGDFPALLYPHDGYDPDDPESGLFRSPILLRVSVTIFKFTLRCKLIYLFIFKSVL